MAQTACEVLMLILFWTLIGLVLYTYAGYPFFLALAARLFRRPVNKAPFEPSVSILLSVYNEEKHIERKIMNLLDLEYPESKIEIHVGSDGSTDETDAIISRIRSPRLHLHRFVSNQGKPHVLNALVREARGEIIVFTDARQEFERSAVRELVENFHDPEVGCASGELFFRDIQGQAIGKGMDAYWKYEKMLRRLESELGSMLGATGAIYAIRRRLYPQIPLETLVDDMYVPLSIVSRGLRAIFDPAARAYDIVSKKGGQEMKRKVRTLAGNYQIFAFFPKLFLPFASPVAWQMFSHKLLRLMVPFFLFGIAAANFFLLQMPFYRLSLLLQLAFYGLAALEAAEEARRSGDPDRTFRRGPGYVPYTFCVLNYAALIALFDFLGRKQKAAWEKAY